MKLKIVKFNEKITEREIEFVKIAYSQLDFYTKDDTLDEMLDALNVDSAFSDNL